MRIVLREQPQKGIPTRKLTSVGKFYEGKDALEIVEAMKSESMFTEFLSLDEYIKIIKTMTRRLYGKRLRVRGKDNYEKAASLIEALREVGLAMEIHD